MRSSVAKAETPKELPSHEPPTNNACTGAIRSMQHTSAIVSVSCFEMSRQLEHFISADSRPGNTFTLTRLALELVLI